MGNPVAERMLNLFGIRASKRRTLSHAPAIRSFNNPEKWDEFIEAALGYPGSTSSALALKLSVVFGCNDRISKDIASLPFRPMRKTDSGQEIARDHDQYFVSKRPHPFRSKYIHQYVFNTHINLYGEAFSPMVRENGRPVAYDLWHPRDVRHKVEGGRLYWINDKLKDSQGQPRIVSDDDMIHDMWFSEDGIRGKSPLFFAKNTIKLGQNAVEMASDLYENQMWSPGYLSYGGVIADKEQAQLISESWTANYAGKDNAGEMPVVDQKSEYKTFTSSLRDAEVAKLINMTTADICRSMGVPGTKMGIRDANVSYNSLEQDNIAYAQDTIIPRVVSIEEEYNWKAIAMKEHDEIVFKYELKNRLRGDVATRTAFYAMAINAGALTINQFLQLEDMNTIGPDGDEHLVQMNLTTLSKLINDDPATIKGSDIQTLLNLVNGEKKNGHALQNN